MLQGLAKAKALKELKSLVEQKASLNGLALAKTLKRQNELRADLGMGKNTPAQTTQAYADTLLFNKSGQILLAQRSAKDEFKPNKWWIVGGKIEADETPKQGAIRELAEETGIKLSDLKFVEKATLPSGGISHRFAGVVNDDTPVHLKKDELQAYEWVDADKLGEYELLGSLADLQDLIELAKEKIHIIEEWDSTTHSEILSNLLVGLANNKDLAVIYNQYFTDHLQGKSVMTQIGKVWINGETKKEVRKNLDELKILTVPYIPEILIKGEIGTPEPNRDLSNPKKPKKQKYE